MTDKNKSSATETHLRHQAKMRWRKLTKERQALGLCVNCHRKAQKVFTREGVRVGVRCSIHRGKNILKCRDWMRENYEHQKAKVEDRLRQRLCINCIGKNRPVANPGGRRCRVCLKKYNKYQREWKSKKLTRKSTEGI